LEIRDNSVRLRLSSNVAHLRQYEGDVATATVYSLTLIRWHIHSAITSIMMTSYNE
jgi:hypothetical protein